MTPKEKRGRKKLPKKEKKTQLRVSARNSEIFNKGGVKEAQKTLQLFWNSQFNLD